MKKAITLCLVLLAGVSNAFNRCQMRYDVRAYQKWYDFGAAFVYGLYEDPPESLDKCLRCDRVGNIVAELHYKVVDLED